MEDKENLSRVGTQDTESEKGNEDTIVIDEVKVNSASGAVDQDGGNDDFINSLIEIARRQWKTLAISIFALVMFYQVVSLNSEIKSLKV